MKSKILITGGAGFIGSNLCQAFIDEGLDVVCFDNLLTGNKANIAHLIGHSQFTFIEGDIRDKNAVENAVEGVDYISHQAALGSVPRSIANPLPTSEINTQGFLNVLTVAKEKGIKRFVYASSSSVYGDAKDSPKKEENLGKPLSPYAVSKLTNELYGRLFAELYGLETIGLRYFNVFGKNQDPNGVYAAAIPKFINKFMLGESPLIHGDGEQTRDFTYIANVVYANKQAILGKNNNAFGKAYNVACGNSYSINTVVAIIKSALQLNGQDVSTIHPVYGEERIGDIRDSLADISRIQSDLSYRVQVSFKEGMEMYIKQLMKEEKN